MGKISLFLLKKVPALELSGEIDYETVCEFSETISTFLAKGSKSLFVIISKIALSDNSAFSNFLLTIRNFNNKGMDIRFLEKNPEVITFLMMTGVKRESILSPDSAGYQENLPPIRILYSSNGQSAKKPASPGNGGGAEVKKIKVKRKLSFWSLFK